MRICFWIVRGIWTVFIVRVIVEILVLFVLVGPVRIVGVLGVLGVVVVCGVVFLVGLVRRGLIRLCLVSLGLVTVARRIGSVVGLAVGGVVLRLGVSGRVLAGIIPMLSVGIDLTGATCVPGAVASLAGVGGLVRVGGGRVCCRPSTVRLLVGAAQGLFEGRDLLGSGGCVGGAVSTMSCPGVSPWPGVESARKTPCLSPVEKPICTVRTHGLALRSLSIGRTSGDSSARCRCPRH